MSECCWRPISIHYRTLGKRRKMAEIELVLGKFESRLDALDAKLDGGHGPLLP